MGVKIEGQRLNHLRFADNIMFITPSITQVEGMVTGFDTVCGSAHKTNTKRASALNGGPWPLNRTSKRQALYFCIDIPITYRCFFLPVWKFCWSWDLIQTQLHSSRNDTFADKMYYSEQLLTFAKVVLLPAERILVSTPKTTRSWPKKRSKCV